MSTSVSSVSGTMSVAQFITLMSASRGSSAGSNPSLTVSNGINLPILSALGGLSSTVGSTASLTILSLYLGSVAGYNLLMTQVNEAATQIQADQTAIAADQAIINDPSSTSAQVSAAQQDLAAKQTDLAGQEALLFFLGILAASAGTQSLVNRIGDTTVPARPLSQLIGANNYTLTLPKDPAAILREFVVTLKISSLFEDPAKLSSLTSAYLAVIGKLGSEQQQIADALSVLDQLDPSAPDYPSQLLQYNAQIASLQQEVTLLQSELFALSLEFILPTTPAAGVSTSTASASPASAPAPSPTATPAVSTAPGTEEENVGFREQIRNVSLELNRDLAGIQAAQAAIAALDPGLTGYASELSQYSDRIASLSRDLSVQQGQLLSLAIRVRSSDLGDGNPDLLAAREELLSELDFLASGTTIPSADLRPVNA